MIYIVVFVLAGDHRWWSPGLVVVIIFDVYFGHLVHIAVAGWLWC